MVLNCLDEFHLQRQDASIGGTRNLAKPNAFNCRFVGGTARLEQILAKVAGRYIHLMDANQIGVVTKLKLLRFFDEFAIMRFGSAHIPPPTCQRYGDLGLVNIRTAKLVRGVGLCGSRENKFTGRRQARYRCLE